MACSSSKSTKNSSGLAALFASAMAIPGLGGPLEAYAQTVPDKSTVKLMYGSYRDRQIGDQERMEVEAPMVWFQSPVHGKTVVEGSFVVDTMSGASPLYLDTLSGASGAGIKDRRIAEELKVTHTFDTFSLGIGGAHSKEDDYRSLGGAIEAATWSEDKNTIFTLGIGLDEDDISSSNNDLLDESAQKHQYMAGITQVLTSNSIVQTSVSFTGFDGYLSDPYKLLDNRPSTRDQVAWMTRYNLYFSDFDAALHTNYRLYKDSWGILGHTLELSWYQPFLENWMIRPHLRYHSQSGADFFSSEFPPQRDNTFYSSDQRISDFGGVTNGIKVTYDIGDGFTADFSYSFLRQQSDLKLGGHNSTNIDSFSAQWFTMGLTKQW